MTSRLHSRARRHGAHRGVTLIEMLVAVTVGLFVVFGLSAVFVSMKTTFISQRGLADLHDAEQLSLTVLTTTLQSARYFPVTAAITKPDLALPAQAVNAGAGVPDFAAGIGITAKEGKGSAPDRVAIRMIQAVGDGLMDCLGNSNKGAASKTVVNVFGVDTTSNELQCSVDEGATWVPLVSGVRTMKLLFAVDTTVAGPTPKGSAERYMTASQVDAVGLWAGVRSVQVTLSFDLPYANAGTGTIDWVQTINLMNQL